MYFNDLTLYISSQLTKCKICPVYREFIKEFWYEPEKLAKVDWSSGTHQILCFSWTRRTPMFNFWPTMWWHIWQLGNARVITTAAIPLTITWSLWGLRISCLAWFHHRYLALMISEWKPWPTNGTSLWLEDTMNIHLQLESKDYWVFMGIVLLLSMGLHRGT